jgi:HlyD family secretion protein
MKSGSRKRGSTSTASAGSCYINRVRPKQDVTAVLDAYPDWQIPARVITQVPTADRQKATVLVRIGFLTLGDPRILPDMGIKVTFLAEKDVKPVEATRPVTLAPKAAIKTAGNESYVFVLRGDTVERRVVQTGGADGDRIEIRSGVQSGDRVVVTAPEGLKEGAKVVVQQ